MFKAKNLELLSKFNIFCAYFAIEFEIEAEVVTLVSQVYIKVRKLYSL